MVIDKVNMFIKEMKRRYPELNFGFFETETDDYIITHNCEDEKSNGNFVEVYSELIDQYFWSHDIYNIGFAYNHEFAKKAKEEKESIIKYVYADEFFNFLKCHPIREAKVYNFSEFKNNPKLLAAS